MSKRFLALVFGLGSTLVWVPACGGTPHRLSHAEAQSRTADDEAFREELLERYFPAADPNVAEEVRAFGSALRTQLEKDRAVFPSYIPVEHVFDRLDTSNMHQLGVARTPQNRLRAFHARQEIAEHYGLEGLRIRAYAARSIDLEKAGFRVPAARYRTLALEAYDRLTFERLRIESKMSWLRLPEEEAAAAVAAEDAAEGPRDEACDTGVGARLQFELLLNELLFFASQEELKTFARKPLHSPQWGLQLARTLAARGAHDEARRVLATTSDSIDSPCLTARETLKDHWRAGVERARLFVEALETLSPADIEAFEQAEWSASGGNPGSLQANRQSSATAHDLLVREVGLVPTERGRVIGEFFMRRVRLPAAHARQIDDLDLRIEVLATSLSIVGGETTGYARDGSEWERAGARFGLRETYDLQIESLLERNAEGDKRRALFVAEQGLGRELAHVQAAETPGIFDGLEGVPEDVREKIQRDRSRGSVHSHSLALAFGIEEHMPEGEMLLVLRPMPSGVARWVVHDGSIEARLIEGAEPGALSDLVQRMYASVSSPDRDPRTVSQALGSLLLDGIWDDLAGVTRLILIPDGELSRIPLGALVGPDGRLLIEHVELQQAPSLYSWAREKDHHSGEGLLAFADPTYPSLPELGEEPPEGALLRGGAAVPPLPETRDEVLALRATLGGQADLRLGADASEAALKALAGARVGQLHLATHGILAGEVPGIGEPALILAAGAGNDGFLTRREASALGIEAALAVLSACNTGSGELVEGEGVLGMSRAFLAGGAQTVVVSLWQVPSLATAELMKRFYAGLAEGQRPSHALRNAQLALLREGADGGDGGDARGLVLADGEPIDPRHPFFWAAFIVLGS